MGPELPGAEMQIVGVWVFAINCLMITYLSSKSLGFSLCSVTICGLEHGIDLFSTGMSTYFNGFLITQILVSDNGQLDTRLSWT